MDENVNLLDQVKKEQEKSKMKVELKDVLNKKSFSKYELDLIMTSDDFN